jgi:hypothetical protein
MTTRRIAVCESCLAAVREEPGGHRMSARDVEIMARQLGADISDHICEAREDGEPCGCACRLYDEEEQ